MIQQVKDVIEEHQLLSEGDKVVVSVSGGPDSLTLLHILWRLQAEYSLNLHVFHLDHMFRGEASREDAEYVARFAKELNIPATIEEYNVPAYIKETGLSKQAAAREIRYRMCTELADNLKADKIAIGQHADDQAETVLMNFLRGAGLDGLSGIEPIRNKNFIRPLLKVWREDIEGYCRNYNLEPRIDKSNLKSVYRRNKVRLELLPHLAEEFNSSIKENLVRMAEIFRAENSFMEKYTAEKYNQIIIESDEQELILDLKAIKNLDLAIQRRVFRQALLDFCNTKRDYYAQHIQQMIDLITDGETGNILQLPQGLRLKKSYNKLKFYWKDDSIINIDDFSGKYSVPGEYEIKELGIKLKIDIIKFENNLQELLHSSSKLYLDYELIGDKIKIRNRREGDRFYPLGMEGSKKLKDFFIDEKIPATDRDYIPIFTTLEGNIFAVGDLRIDDRFKVTDQTEKILALSMKRI
ncbi:tRNA lysidine(34) synthetase TilS [Sporohalobacter salinus]|uniref:tRNA lysidine(34) synthetase TilS n=1 Tax=Sporohalobacter salinus TaxID=1494606 RepID=UPI001961A87A|nr:tRNA lysidine(34) synthetase TilS [Sporohalobacter salinus]MBM7623870.1 tRNA(Ile)-lysidine synthase [Sporohalobacter salinus]